MKFLVHVSLLVFSLSLYGDSPADPRIPAIPKRLEPCRLANLGGVQPDKVCVLKKFLNEFDQLINRRPQHTVLMLHGIPGTGKTTVSYELAKESGNEPLFFLASTFAVSGMMVENTETKQKEIKTGAAAISALYEKSRKIVEQTGRPVVIVFDDVHKIAPKKPHSALRPECHEALAQLNAELSPRNKDRNSLIITILTANIKDKDIDAGLVSRCTLVEVSIPNEENRLEIINYYANKEKHHLTERIRKELAKKHYEFTGRDIEIGFENARGWANYEGLEYVEDKHLIKAFDDQQQKLNSMKPTLWEWIVGTVFGTRPSENSERR